MDSLDAYFYLGYLGSFLLVAGFNYGPAFFRFGDSSTRLNQTAQWTPVPDFVAERAPSGIILTEYEHRIITPYLEPGEELEGFTRGWFVPRRPQDYGFGRGSYGYPLLIAATPRRLLMFEVTRLTLHRYRSIPYETIAYLRPPQATTFGSSGPMSLGLHSGFEYRLQFLSPLAHEESMAYEHRLAAFLRWMAPRLSASSQSVA